MNAVSPRSDALADNGLAYLPMFFGMRGRTVLLIAGTAALPKLALLRRAGARVRLVAQHLDDSMADMIAGDRMVVRISAPPAAHHFDDVAVAIDSSGDEAINHLSVSLARAADVPINVVDRPALCDFILPSIVDRSPVIVAVSTGGVAPAIARLLRQRLEMAIPAGFGRVAVLAARVRHMVRDRLQSAVQRSGFWEDLFDGRAADLAIAGHMDGAVAVAHGLLEQSARLPSNGGDVHVLHVTSGEPDLLTVRAARLIRMADVIVHEPAIEGAVLDLARRDALKIEMQINGMSDPALAQDWAGSGRMVVYLKANT